MPDVDRLPLHAPDAVHPLAFVADQEIVAAPPLVTETGLAVNDKLGTGGGGVAATDTVALLDTDPPLPVQFNE